MGSPPQQLFFRLDLSIIAPVSRHYRFDFKILAQVASYFRISITAPVARFFRFYLLIFDPVIFGPVARHFLSNLWFLRQ